MGGVCIGECRFSGNSARSSFVASSRRKPSGNAASAARFSRIFWLMSLCHSRCCAIVLREYSLAFSANAASSSSVRFSGSSGSGVAASIRSFQCASTDRFIAAFVGAALTPTGPRFLPCVFFALA